MDYSPRGAGDSLTYFASAERTGPEQLQSERKRFLEDELAVALLEAIPGLAVVLDLNRQIIAANKRVLELMDLESPDALLGQRPGEALQCVHVENNPNGCGTGEPCQLCGAVNAVLACMENKATAQRECRLRTKLKRDGGAVDVDVQASFIRLGDLELIVAAMRDISAEKRRAVLERAFFHDVLNIASGLKALVELLAWPTEDEEAEAEYRRELGILTNQITDELIAQRQLMQAETGRLTPDFQQVSISEILESVADLYRHHSVAIGKEVQLTTMPPSNFETDPVLLRRVLGNLVKNALEATPPGGTVELGADDHGTRIIFSVHNESVMPPEVQQQLFQRSFSTKAESGRGIGTFSSRLLTERCLGGVIGFTSSEGLGTTFTVSLPRQGKPRITVAAQAGAGS